MYSGVMRKRRKGTTADKKPGLCAPVFRYIRAAKTQHPVASQKLPVKIDEIHPLSEVVEEGEM